MNAVTEMASSSIRLFYLAQNVVTSLMNLIQEQHGGNHSLKANKHFVTWTESNNTPDVPIRTFIKSNEFDSKSWRVKHNHENQNQR